MFDAYVAPIHGGSVIGFVTRQGKREPSQRLQDLRKEEIADKSNEFLTYLTFADRIRRMKDENVSYLESARLKGKSVFGLGAPVKGNTLLNYFGVGPKQIQCLVEKNELRRGLFSPGMHIPVIIEKELERNPDVYYVLAWNFKKEILANYKGLIEQGVEFYFPVNPKET